MISVQKGFSLIELLVVVAIIGVLAAAGVVGYQNYTENARQSVLKDRIASANKAVNADIAAISFDLPERTEMTRESSKAWTGDPSCGALAYAMVEVMNTNYQNPYNSDYPAAAYGNLALSVSGASSSNQLNDDAVSFASSAYPSLASNRSKLGGITFVSCLAPGVTADHEDFRLYQCACSDNTAGGCLFETNSDPSVILNDPEKCYLPPDDPFASSSDPFPTR